MGLLDGKKAVVLGASSGIGWRIAERFAEQGAELIVAARREERLAALAKKIGGVAIRCDVSDDNQVRALADAARVVVSQLAGRGGGAETEGAWTE